MLFYWFLCIFSMVLAWLCMHSKAYIYRNNILPSVMISSMPLTVASALRYGIGTDYFNYIDIYEIYTSRGIRGTYEPLFYYLGRGLSLLGANAQWLIGVCSILTVMLVFYCIFRLSPSPILSIFLYVSTTLYMSSFNTMREHVGAAILLFSLIFLNDKKIIPFVALVLLASGIHYSCILFLIMVVFSKIEVTSKKVIVLTGVFVLIRPILADLIERLVIGTNYERYLELGGATGMTMYLGIVLQFAILLFASIFYVKDNHTFNLLYSLQLLATWIALLNGFVPLISRVRWIFSLPSILLLPVVLQNMPRSRNKQLITIAIYGSFVVYAFIVIDVLKSYGVVPYDSILF